MLIVNSVRIDGELGTCSDSLYKRIPYESKVTIFLLYTKYWKHRETLIKI